MANRTVYHQLKLHPFALLKVQHHPGDLHPEPESPGATLRINQPAEREANHRWIQYPLHLLTDSFPLTWLQGKTDEEILADSVTRPPVYIYPDYLPRDNRSGDTFYSINVRTLNAYIAAAAHCFQQHAAGEGILHFNPNIGDPTEHPVYDHLIHNLAREVEHKRLYNGRLEVETCLSFEEFNSGAPDYYRWPASTLYGTVHRCIPDFKTPSYALLRDLYSDVNRETLLVAHHLQPLCNLTRTPSDAHMSDDSSEELEEVN